MNHVKCIFNTSVPRRVSSNTAITQYSNYKNEGGFKKRSTKPRTATVDYSFLLAVKRVYPLLLIQRHYNDTRLEDYKKGMLCGTQGSKSKSIATSLRRLLSERKLPLQNVDGINSKQTVRLGSSSSLSYDRTINYDDDRDSRSYAQMITAYNETMMTVDNSSSIFHDRSSSKLNVQLSKTLFRSTSTLTSSAYNFENATIKENMEESSMTDLSYAIDTIIDKDDDFYEEKTKNLDLYNSTVIPKANKRSYANIIADYSAAMDVASIMKRYRNDFPKMSTMSFTSPKATALETTGVGRNVSEFVSSPDLSENSRKKVDLKEQLEWLRKVDKIINDLKMKTQKTSFKINQKGLKENDILECVAEQAVWVDKSTLINKNKSNSSTPRKSVTIKSQTKETQNYEIRAEKSDKAAGVQTSSTSSTFESTTKKDWTQVPKNTETIPTDPQVELRMVPSGNESIVSVNVEEIAKAIETRNPDSKELSVVVSSSTKDAIRNRAARENMKEGSQNFGSMRISISEESLPVKELELSINGKPISDVRSIKARTETLNVLTSMDMVEIRVPYSQNNPTKTNPSTKSFVKNVQSAESVLKLRIATAFDGTYPVLTTGVTKNVQPQSHVQTGTSKVRYARTEGSTVKTKVSEVPPTRLEAPAKQADKSSDSTSKKTFGYNTNQDKSEKLTMAVIRNKQAGGSTVSTSMSGGDVNRPGRFGDIDLRLTETFGRVAKTKHVDNKVNTKATTEIKKKTNPEGIKPSLDDKKAESSKNTEVKKSTSEKDGIKSLADLIAKHSRRSGDGSSSPASGKPRFGSNQNREGSKPPGKKRDSKPMDEADKNSTLDTQSSKTKTSDQRIISKWSPWWTSSDAYTKLRKKEDYNTQYSTPTNVMEKQKPKEFDSTVKVASKTTKESPLHASEEEKTFSAKSQDLSKSKERKYETKESTTVSSKVHDAESTLKSPFKSENIRVTRYDSPPVNEKSKRYSFSSQTSFAEEKLNKRNEGPPKKKTMNASTLKEVESKGEVDTKIDVKMPIKETSQIGAVWISPDVKIQAEESMMNAKSKDKVAKDEETTINEKLIHRKASSTSGFPDKHLNMHQNIKKKDSASNVTKTARSASILSNEDKRLKDILNSMKPIEKKKDGTLIDYGVKVASRKKPEKLKGRPKSETTDITKEKQGIEQRLGSQTDIKTSYSVEKINVNMKNPIKYNPKNVEIKKEDSIEKKETVSAKDQDISKDEIPATLGGSDRDSLHERISKVLEKAKEQMQYHNIPNESLDVNIIKGVQKSKENVKEIHLDAKKPEKTAARSESLNERTSKSPYSSRDRISYENIIKESPKPSFKKEAPMNTKKATQKSDEDTRKSLEGTVTPKPSKLSPNNPSSDTGTTEQFAGTIVRRSPRESEKEKSKNVTYKHSLNTTRSPLNAIEKPNAPLSADTLKTQPNKKKDDSSGSENTPGTPSSPVNPGDSGPPNMSNLNSPSPISIDLEESNQFDNLRCTKQVKQIDVKPIDEPVKPKRPDKELVYSVWLQRSKEKAESKKP